MNSPVKLLPLPPGPNSPSMALGGPTPAPMTWRPSRLVRSERDRCASLIDRTCGAAVVYLRCISRCPSRLCPEKPNRVWQAIIPIFVRDTKSRSASLVLPPQGNGKWKKKHHKDGCLDVPLSMISSMHYRNDGLDRGRTDFCPPSLVQAL